MPPEEQTRLNNQQISDFNNPKVKITGSTSDYAQAFNNPNVQIQNRTQEMEKGNFGELTPEEKSTYINSGVLTRPKTFKGQPIGNDEIMYYPTKNSAGSSPNVPKYINTAKNEFYDLTDPNAPKLIGNMTDFANQQAESGFQNYLETIIAKKLETPFDIDRQGNKVARTDQYGRPVAGEFANRDALLNSDWWKTFVAQEKPGWLERESGKIYQDLLGQTEFRESLAPTAPAPESPYRPSEGFGGPPIQTADQSVFNQPATTERPAEPTFNAAAAGSGAGASAQYGDILTLAGGQRISPQDPNYATYFKQINGASSVPINAPGISSGQVNQENFYIGATNWANLQKQFTPAQLEAATKLIDGKRYWNQAVEIGKLNAQGQPITGEILKGGQGMVDLSGTTTDTGAGATATSNTNIAVDQAVADIEARQKIIEQTQTAEQKQASDLDKSILNLIGQEKGKASFEEEQRKKLIGEGEANLNTQLTKSKNRILALQAEKQKVLTDIENKPITLSSIAGQQAQQLAKYNSEILLETAISNGLMNNIFLAEQQIEQAVNAKFAPTEEALRIAKAQRDAIRGTVTADEKIQLDALDKADEVKKQAIADAKTEQTNIKNIMLEAIKVGITDNNVLSKITNAKTLTEAMGVLGKNMPKEPVKTSPIYTEWQDYKRTGGTLSFDAYMTMDANRKRSISTTNIITPQQYDTTQAILDKSKGTDGFVNTEVYKKQRNAAKDKTTFDKNFSYMLNPNDPTASGFISNVKADIITPEKQSIINDAKAAIDQVKQRYGDWNATRSQIIDQVKQQDGFDISPYI